MARIELQNITKRYGGTRALKDLSLTVEDGEFFVLLGRTGAGKTTTLRVVAGLEKPDEGRVFIGDSDVTSWTAAERDVALVLQQYSLYPRLTVRGNLEFPLRPKVRNMNDDEIRRRVDRAAKTLQITHLLDRKVERLSGGEMQRVSIGRAIVRDPRVFLMDEPLSALDAKLREALRVELKKLHQDLGATFLFGLLEAIANRWPNLDLGFITLPNQVMTALPYILTVILLAGFIGRAIPPKAGGVAYVKER